MRVRQESGTEVSITWRGRRATAFVPALLGKRDLTVSLRAARLAAAAAADVASSAAVMPLDVEPLARLLLRAEGVASSFLEGIAAPLADIVVAETAVPGTDRGPAGWVAANLAAVTQAVDSAHDTNLSIALLCDWHRTLMASSPLPGRYVGAVRQEQGWIGGSSPLDAMLVTPPPDRLGALLADLVGYANRVDDDLDPVVQAAIAHAQFETIHPFADGNGRIGRILVSWLLTRRLSLLTPPPVSTRIAADRNGYLAGLTLFRLGQHDQWVRWFAATVSGAGLAQRDLAAQVSLIRDGWPARLAGDDHRRPVRSDALARRVLDLLPRHLVLSAPDVARLTGSQLRSAQAALATLADAGVLARYARPGSRPVGRPTQLYVSLDLLALAGSSPVR